MAELRNPDERLCQLVTGWHDLAPPEVASELVQVWPLAHAPLHRFDSAELVAMFSFAGYVSDRALRPVEPLTVYRGELATSRPGMSWTADQAVALTYATGYRTVGSTRLVRASIPPGAILARFESDDEVVVDPAALTEVTIVSSFAQWEPPGFNVGGILDRLGR